MKSLLKKIQHKIVNIIKEPVRYLQGKKVLRQLVSIKRNNEVFIILPKLMGDTVLGLTCIEDFINANANKSIILLFENPNHIKWYEYVSKKCDCRSLSEFLSDNNISLEYIYSLSRISKLLEKAIKYNILVPVTVHYKKLRKEKTGTRVQLRTHIFKLESEGKVSVPNPSMPDKFKYNLSCNDVIINPYTTSIVGTDFDLYKKMVILLKSKGYNIYTNVLPNQKELDGTSRLECSLEELFYNARKCKLFISTRSGVLDYLIFSGCNIMAIYENVPHSVYCMWKLCQWKSEGKLIEIFMPILSSKEKKENMLLKEIENI